jgi:tetratricopeptide (TPR) repeat protein
MSCKDVAAIVRDAEACPSDYCFPNKLEDIAVLRFAAEFPYGIKAKYYLGNLFYDRLQWEEAIALWESSAKAEPGFPAVHRNLSLAYCNKRKDLGKAKAAMEKAFALNTSDARIFLELDQLYKKLGRGFEERLKKYEEYPELIKGRDDLYIEYITLVNMTGEHEKAYKCIMGHNFHPWEGGEGKISAQYALSLLAMAKKARSEGCFDKAEKLLNQALTYPENLGEGKLEGTRDNHIYYHLGLVLEAQGKTEGARECFEKATSGTDEPAGAMYYNDQPADRILYQGLAYMKLGKAAEAKSRFYRLIDYGERHLEDEVKIGYFAVSLPDFLIFEDDYALKNRVHCYYLMALGNIGLGNTGKAKVFIDKAIKWEPCHLMCRVYSLYLLCHKDSTYK